MKKAGLIASIILLTGVIAFYLLSRKSSDNVQLVKFKGVGYITNLTKGHFDWVSSIDYADDYADKVNAVPAQKNDFLYCLSEENSQVALFIQNRKQTDKIANLRFDSLGVYVDGQLATLNINQNEEEVSNWLRTSGKEEIRNLQSVYISDSLSENTIEELKKIGKSTSDIGLIMDFDGSYLYELQEALNPSWLWLSSVEIMPDGASDWNITDNLESLTLTDTKMGQIKFEDFKKLKMLHIDDLDSTMLPQLGQLPKSLSSLQISNSGIRDLDFLGNSLQLKEVVINHCPLLKDISSLEKFSHLTTLSLADCDSIADLKPLSGLKELTWFAPPKNISEQQLASVFNSSPNIESLVLVDCQQIKSLHRLKDFQKLSFLTLISTSLAPDSLARFKNLKYLAYGNNASSDSLSIASLQRELPNTLVTAAEPFCMGTGWLILFFGLILAAAVVAVKVKNKVSA